MENIIEITNQVLGITVIILTTLTVNNPVWGTLGVQNLNPADSKYTAKGFFRRCAMNT